MRKHPFQAIVKRVIDVIISFWALCLLSPVMLLVATVIKVFLGSPILFKQIRPGFLGQPFTIVKFRTLNEAGLIGDHSICEENRLTKVGSFLRSSSLDELPELWNVLKGDMSLVGPRPLLMQYLDRYSAEQARRHEVKPGLTGWAQVNGRNALSWDEKLALDVWYVDHASLWLDLRIVMKSVWEVFAQHGINAPGQVGMTEFLGSEKKKAKL